MTKKISLNILLATSVATVYIGGGTALTLASFSSDDEENRKANAKTSGQKSTIGGYNICNDRVYDIDASDGTFYSEFVTSRMPAGTYKNKFGELFSLLWSTSADSEFINSMDGSEIISYLFSFNL